MPIFPPYLDRPPTRRESASGGHDQVEPQAENESIMSTPPDQLEYSHLRRGRRSPSHLVQSLSRDLSEESIRTELCEGPVYDSSPSTRLLPLAQTPDHGNSPGSTVCTDRATLIERLKRGESPTWIPNRYFEPPWRQQEVSMSPTRSPTHTTTPTKPNTNTTTSPGLLPPPTITPEKDRTNIDNESRYQDGMKIERPRSALHTGDFTHDETVLGLDQFRNQADTPTSQEPTDDGRLPWIATSPPRHFMLNFEKKPPHLTRSDEVRSALSSLSTSASTSFVYKPPTSPLVQSESNEEVDLISPINHTDLDPGISRQQRRHTMLPSFSSSSYSYGYCPSPLQRQSPSLRQEKTFPYQAHQPRRSLTTSSSLSISASSPQTPTFLHGRRPSFGSDVSPLQHASMVGSYEESILRGRMSTTPSKPLDFLAQIGVLGLGKCKSSLRCPPHVTLPFPAVFYSYASSSHSRSKEEGGPSPYVGQIDLENGLPSQGDDTRSKRKQQSRAVERSLTETDMIDTHYADTVTSGRMTRKTKRISGSPRAPPGGSYRIPEKGQIQIIIKNPNKTAVKLFLVPYDLAGMEPGTKTFVRQRSYSNGPIIDNMPDLKGDSSADRPILRYLVHLHICCPSRGRFYLYKSIRVVFANRVPDGKERLRNEITLPEPRFTPYKAIRVMHPPLSSSKGLGASLTADAALRRRSAGFYSGGAGRAFDIAEGFSTSGLLNHHFSYGPTEEHAPIEPIPFMFPAERTRRSAEDGSAASEPQSLHSPGSSAGTTGESSNASNWGGYDNQVDKYNKLNKGDIGYGGNAFAGLINGNPAVAESLLSKRLRSLGVEKPDQREQGQDLESSEQ
ncbi:hypothetical protein F5B22DRAFT_596844 [Xylaria bambusicola]|uniref:uncharacterized protein n=1 Tax=Xylaria bambusicola TaxID=326684 RepID=UPI0020082713|nr:uncharacterized protein F5B22DRAFT_596844 [Xylaria bambusicola]KAI0521440.1 hypothetical protein F5B22DRAFT_596844 [Xylaria bambusicola]